ncbi:hypothetical protein AGMMS49928_29510 [Spirochaetia bacterium]|nr:hypothetical protein AGMMS49928_29510 [Spirochaetia bacterium]
MICVSEADFKTIQEIIARYAAGCEVHAFGSRYKWTSNDYSDLDLAFVGDKKLSLAEIAKIREAFEESDLPFRVDVLDWHGISKEFQAIINQGYEVIYSPQKGASKGWQKVRLGDVCEYRNEKIETDSLDTTTYISTENMLPEKTGVTFSTGLPATQYTQKYSIGNVLISNIRPYFKKIWFAVNDGGCSNDVLVFKAKENYLPKFLYYILSNDKFFNYSTQTAKGTKMPRGDKTAIMNFMVPDIPLPTQHSIAATLSCLDEKIELNNRINANLEAQAQAIFKSWFVDFDPFKGGEFVDSELGKIPKGWNIKALDEICKIKGGKRLPKGVNLITEPNTHPYIRVRDMNNSIFVQNNGTLEYVDDDTQQFISRYIVSGGDIIISIVGTVGLVSKIHNSLDKANLTENCVKLTGFDNKFSDYIYLFLTSKEGQDCIKRGTVGAVQAKLPLKNIQSIPLIIPPQDIICDFYNFTFIAMQQIANNLSENVILAAIRNILLPRLMSGEIEGGEE